MFEQLETIETRYRELGDEMGRPEVASKPDLYRKLSKEYRDIEEIVTTYRTYAKVREELIEAEDIIHSSDDSELVGMAQMEKEELVERETDLTE
ncbi:MAG: PCRF domain-containing protein, partial [Candidatus Latescibacteria bacterium]|nr:PCRF domain-containing protein [Candidatus Latescibacterota bacterium]